jgi:hypothetical protein
MKKVNITLIMILVSIVSFSQLRIEAGYGFGTYSLKDLRDMNSEILRNLPVEGRITDDFPAQPYYNAGLLYQVTDIVSLGITGNYYTTGSRISYKDYSGELKIDNVLSSYSPGIAAGFKLVDKKLKLFEETRISYSFTKLKMKEKIISLNDETVFKSCGLQVEPRFKLSYNICGLEFGLNAGYLVDFGGKNRLVGNKDAILQFTGSKEAVKTNWSGIRLGASIGYYFQLQKYSCYRKYFSH